ncbi:YoaK family protein [Terriglobus sp. 2YAB30_2]|uniref:YoaK family protein n=1 Tax=unclassified Terriglobus TaxID=2628988 RepID=UPI003F9A8F09
MTTSPATETDTRLGVSTHALLAFAGGYLDAFTYIGHGHVFANAMTGNVILLAIDLVTVAWQDAGRHFLVLVMFLLGIAAARLMRHEYIAPAIRLPEAAVLVLEIAILMCLSFSTSYGASLGISMAIAFAASLQVATFRQVNKQSYSSTFTTGNLHTMMRSWLAWLVAGRSADDLQQAKVFAQICGMFFLGAVLGAYCTPRFHNHALWGECFFLLVVLVRVVLVRSKYLSLAER